MTKQSINRGRQLQFAREYRQYSQTKLAKAIDGLSQANISKFEGGFNTISNDQLVNIMELLNFPLQFMEVQHQKLNIYKLSK